MKNLALLFCLGCAILGKAQLSVEEQINSRLINLHSVADNDETFVGYEQLKNEIGDAQIVMLGEQSHTDATTFDTKIKLIKYLHQEMGFDILAFESGLYDCNKAWHMIQEGHDVKDALGKGIFTIWSTKEELNPLYDYIEQESKSDNQLMIAGFDSQFIVPISSNYSEDLTLYLKTFENVSSYQEGIQELQTFINKLGRGDKVKKDKAQQNISFVRKLIELINHNQDDELSKYWILTLENLAVFISDISLGTDVRDKQMAENLVWLKEKYPNKKIICWGATSHFLYNSSLIKMDKRRMQRIAGGYYQEHSMMGDYIKEKYGDNVYTIGFIAHEGSFGFMRPRKIKSPKENSLEYIIGKAPMDNYFLPLKNISLAGYLSRPLAHQNMKTDIAQVMDGVVFNRYMKRPRTDWEFLLYLFPENTMRAKKKERILRNYKINKEKRELEKEQKRQQANAKA